VGGFRIRGPFDLAVFVAAAEAVAARHSVFRTRLVERDGAVLQILEDDLRLAPISHDLPGLDELGRLAEIEAFIASEERRVFDLAQAPLARIVVLAFSPDDHAVISNLHHVISDGQSQDILAKELVSAYNMRGRAAASDATIEFVDFSAWQTEIVSGEAGRRQIAFWEKTLASAPAHHGLPLNRSRAAALRAGARLAVDLDDDSIAAVRDLSAALNLSTFTVLMTAYAAVIARYSGETDIVIGFANAYRDKPELQLLIGNFVNSLPARFDLSARPSFSELGAQVRRIVHDALANRDVPLEKLVDELGIARDAYTHPVFQIFFSYNRTESRNLRLADARVEAFNPDFFGKRSPKFELSLVVDDGENLRCTWEWDESLFDRDAVAAMARAFATLIKEAAARLDTPLGRIALAEPDRRLTGPSLPVLAEPFNHRFDRHVAERPEAIAVVDRGACVTYAELDRRAAALAGAFAAMGVGPGARIAAPMHRSIAAVATMLGAFKAGATFVPLDPSAPADRLAAMMKIADAKLAIIAEASAFLDGDFGTPILRLNDDGVIHAAQNSDSPGVTDAPGAAYIVFTSGSTGTPKGVVISHENICYFLDAMAARFDFAPGQSFSIAVNFATDIGLQNLFCGLGAGGTLVLLDDETVKDPARFAASEAAAGTDVGLYTPGHFLALYQPDVFGTRLPRRVLLLEGEALTREAVRPALAGESRCRLVNGYGPTETTMLCATFTCEGAPPDERVPIGWPLANVTLRVVNEEGVDQPLGAVGELWISGPTVGEGYCGPDAPKGGFARVDGQPVYKTGDRVRLRASLGLEFLGRGDRQIKLRGHRVELGEIEAALLAHPGIAACAARFFPGSGSADGRIVAYAVATAGSSAIAEAALRNHLERRLPPHMVPQRIMLIERFPSLANGKIDYRALPEPAAELETTASDPPRTPTEDLLSRVWSRVLGTTPPSRDANFFALGGNSIKCIATVAEARRVGLNVTAAQIARWPRLCDLAAVIDASEEPAAEQPTELPPFALVPSSRRNALPGDVVDAFPLSSLQRGMIANYLRADADPKYLIIRRQPLRGSIDVGVLHTVLADIISAYPALRTSIVLDDGEHDSLQLIHRTADVPLEFHDISEHSPEEREDLIKRHVDQRRNTGLRLERAPLFALALFKHGPDRHDLVWTIHHAIVDGWSIARLVDEVLERYERLQSGAAPHRRPLAPPSFAEIIRRERAYASDEARCEAWRAKLSGTEPAIIPRYSDVVGAHAADVPIRRFDLPAELVDALDRFARGQGVSAKAAYLAAYARVIGAICGRLTLVTGLCTHQRPALPGAETTPGLYVTTLPIVIEHEAESWSALVRRAHAVEQEIFAERHMPLAHVCSIVGRQQLFEHQFNFADFHDRRDKQTRETSEDDSFLFNLNEFALTINVVLQPGAGSSFYLSYDPAKLAPGQIDGIAELFLCALNGIAISPDAPPDLVDPRLRERLLAQWNATQDPIDCEGRIQDGFFAQTKATPQAIALIDRHGEADYESLARWSAAFARRLAEVGVRRGDRVLIMLPRGRLQVVAILATLSLGAVFVPVDAAWPAVRRRSVAQQTRAAALVQAEAESAEDLGIPVAALGMDSLELGAGAPIAPSPGTPDDLAYIMFTSGSTGVPKGVAMSHRAVLNTLLPLIRDFGIGQEDRVLAASALTFDLAIFDIFATLWTGGAIVFPSGDVAADPGEWADLCSRRRVTIWNSVPVSAQLLLDVWQGQADLASSLRLIMMSGDRIPPSLPSRLAQTFPTAQIVSLGGATEAAIWSILHRIDDNCSAWSAVPYGRPMANQSFYVLDEQDELAVPGAIGHLHIGGAGLANGYYGDPERTAASFYENATVGGRLYRTGDLGFWRNDGVIEFVGRSDHQVKVRGHRIELGEVEACFERFAGVDRAIAAAVAFGPADGGEKRLVVYLAMGEGHDMPDAPALRRHATTHLPPYMAPHAFVHLTQLPISANGKVDRANLPPPRPEDFDHGEGHVAPRTADEDALHAQWKQILGIEKISVHANFFALGGDSVMALRLLALIARTGRRIALRDFYAEPTIEGMARAMRAPACTDERTARPIPLLPAQAWLLGSETGDLAHFNQALTLAIPPSIDPSALEAALAALVDRHASLRLRVRLGPAGWSASLAAADEKPAPLLERFDLRGLAREERLHRQAEHAEQAQRAFDIGQGPLLKALLFEHEEAARLTLFVHHLATDAVSWQTMLADLRDLYAHFRAPGAGPPPPAAGGVVARAELLNRLAANGRFSDEAAYWAQQLAQAFIPDLGDGPRPAREGARLDVPAWPRVRQLAAGRGHSAEDVLLASTQMAMTRWSGRSRHVLLLEHHGRDDLDGLGDAAGLVGWFTAAFPMALEGAADEPLASLAHAARTVRAAPSGGLGYGVLRHLAMEPTLCVLPEPWISFNYLGEIAGAAREGVSDFDPVDEPTGCSADPEIAILGAISISAVGRPDGLRLSIDHDPSRVTQDQVRDLLASFTSAMRDLELALAAAPPAKEFPATPMQEGILLHSLREPEAGAYVNQLGLTLRGPLDEERLRRAWRVLTARHAILRTEFVRGPDGHRQRIADDPTVPWNRLDLRGLNGEDLDLRRNAAKEADRTRPFELARAPLMRVTLAILSDDTTELIWTYHHALFDGWSLPILLTDLVALYTSDADDDELPPAPSFDRYVEWLRDRDNAAAAAYWKDLLGDFESPVRITRTTGSASAANGQLLTRALSGETNAQLKELGRKLKVTPNLIIQAAWAYLLHRHSGEDDIVFGATHAGRPPDLADAGSTVGLFINTIPVRIRFAPDDDARTVLQRLFEQQAASAEFAAMPLAEIQRCSSVPGGVDLFESIIVFENFQLPEFSTARMGDIVLEKLESREDTHFPLTLIVVEGKHLELRLNYKPAFVTDLQAQRLLDHLETILTAFITDSSAKLALMPMLTEHERGRLAQWRRVESVATDDDWLSDAFDRVACARPDDIALVFESNWMTFGELKTRAENLAQVLTDAGAAGGRVGISLPRGPDVVIAILAALKAGASYVPLDPALPFERRAFMVEDAACGIIISDDPAWAETSIQLVAPTASEPFRPFVPPSDEAKNREAYLIYTSGTTGQPKGVAIDHRNVLRLIAATQADFTFGPNDCWTLFHSYGFDFSVWEIWGALLHGGRLVIVCQDTARNAAAFATLIEREGVTVLNQTPSAFFSLAEAVLRRDFALSNLRLIIFGGEALDFSDLRPWVDRYGLHQPRLVNMYGITETTVHTTIYEVQAADVAGNCSKIGRPLRDLEVRICDRHGRDAPIGAIGEILVAGGGVTPGYNARPQLNAERFILIEERRYYRSGDLGYYDEDGCLHYLGRRDGQVKIRGFRIEIGEVEAKLSEIEGLSRAVVLKSGAGRDASLVAYVVSSSRDDEQSFASRLRERLATTLPAYMIPAAIVRLSSLPLNANGKIDRSALPRPALDRKTRWTPSDETERALATIWSELLGASVTAGDVSFFDLGGHSIKLAQAIERARERLGVTVSFGALYNSPTIVAQAALIRAEIAPKTAEDRPRPLTAEEKAAGAPLLPAQSRIWYLSLDPRQNTAYVIPLLLEIDGALDIDALHRALSAALQRHEGLRSVIRASNGEPRQFAVAVPERVFEVVSAAGEAEARETAERLFRAPFDLAEDLPTRATLIALNPRRHWLALAIHHIAADAWSLKILFEDLVAAYRAEVGCDGSPSAEAAPFHVGDAAAWMARPAQRLLVERDLEYWRRSLSGHPGILNLRTDRPRRATLQVDGNAVPIALGAELSQRLASARRTLGTPEFVQLLAAYALLAHKLSGDKDIIVGTAFGARPRAEFERAVGLFANTLPIRISLASDMTAGSFLQQAAQAAGQAFEHGAAPLEQIIDAVGLVRPADRMPLFQIAFAYQNLDAAEARLPELSLRRLPVERRTAKFDLTLTLADSPSGLMGELEYDATLFRTESAAMLVGGLGAALAWISGNPDRRIAECDLGDLIASDARIAAGRGRAALDFLLADEVDAELSELDEA
jgi:amino acid adenylation domain-containing protein/non-ribosomal peptide synthase protein (TIGR01720 family)